MAVTLGMPLDDLPLSDDLSVSDAWINMAVNPNAAEDSAISPRHHLRIVAQGDPRSSVTGRHSGWHAVTEPRSPRGVAGVVADVINDRHEPDDFGEWILIIESSASPNIDIAALFDATDMPSAPSLIFGISDLDRPCGSYLVRREIYDLVPGNGFFDFKEQLLSRVISNGLQIEAVPVAKRAHKLDTRQGWLAIVKEWAESRSDKEQFDMTLEEGPWRRRDGACVISPNAVVDDATIISSVVMDDAVIEKGAVVARSIVGPRTRVPAGAVLVDAVFTGRDRGITGEIPPRMERSQDWSRMGRHR